MKLKPTTWTHHHVARLFHISFFLCYISIVISIMGGMVLAWQQAQATDVVSSGSVGVTAQVGSIQPGPTIVADSGSGNFFAPPPSQIPENLPDQKEQEKFVSQPPVLTMEEDPSLPRQTVTENGKKISAPSYNSGYPNFHGHTNIPHAIISIEVHSTQIIRATTQADDQGSWFWTPTQALTKGLHTMTVTAQDPLAPQIKTVATWQFYISAVEPGSNAPAGSDGPQASYGTLFDVLVTIPDQFKQITPGNEVLANIQFINFGSAGHPQDVKVDYQIQDEKHRVVMESSETVAVATKLAIIKSFHLAPTLARGEYTLIVSVPTENVLASSSDTFMVSGDAIIPLGQNAKVDFTIVIQALLALFLLFAFIAYFEYNKVTVLSADIKRISERDLADSIN